MTQTAVTAAAYSVSDLPGGERNLIGLARVSTDGQDAQLQRDALAAGGCGRIYKEKISTRKAHWRPAWPHGRARRAAWR